MFRYKTLMLRHAQHTAFILQLTKLPDLPYAYIGIADDVG